MASTSSCAPARCMCLAGENGAGKSTLIKILTGAIRRDEGDYLVDGRDIGNPTPGRPAPPASASSTRSSACCRTCRSAENLMMGHLPARRGDHAPARAGAPSREMLERVGLEWLDPGTQVAHALARRPAARRDRQGARANPRVLIFDEPTTALSESETKALLARIHGLRDEGHAMMYVTHHLEEMFEIGDRVTCCATAAWSRAAR